MKILNQKKQERAQKLEAMQAITAVAVEAKRNKSTEELDQWNGLKGEVEALSQEIETLEFEERNAINIVKSNVSKEQETKEQKEVRNYDLSKAIREYTGSGLTGLEKEMHEEGVNEYRSVKEGVKGLVIPSMVVRNITAAGQPNHIAKAVAPTDYINDKGILSQLGVTVYNNLTGQVEIPFSDGFSAAWYGEGVAAEKSPYADQSGKLEAKRVQGWNAYTAEYLAQTATVNGMLQEMVGSLEIAAAKKVLDTILSIEDVAINADTDAAAAVTFKKLMKLKGALKSAQFRDKKFVTGGELFAELEATAKDAGSGRMIIEGGSINGYSAVDAQGLMLPDVDKHAVIFGDFSRAYLGLFGGVELLIDPFSLSDEGKTKVTYRRLADVVVNPSAFKALTNGKVV